MNITKKGYTKIEHKIPAYVRKLRGIFISVSYLCGESQVAGIVSLNFNGQAFKTYQFCVYQTVHLADTSNPSPLHEDLEKNSFMQGYYYDFTNLIKGAYTLSIYLHYEP